LVAAEGKGANMKREQEAITEGMRRKTVVGEYGRDGYAVMTADGKVLHSAGANAFDSHAPGRDASLATIRKWCVKTGKEIAAERGAVWGGAERV